MAWAKAKTAIAIGVGVALIAAGIATSAVTAVNTSMEDTISKLERHTGQKIVSDKRLNLPTMLDLEGLPLPEALDQLSVQVGAYWSVDYVVYNSDLALRQLVEALQNGIELQDVNWTNLSSNSLKPQMAFETHGQGTRSSRPSITGAASPGFVNMVVVLNPEASHKLIQGIRKKIKQGKGDEGPDEAKTIGDAMKEGMADGVLAPERLLAQTQLIPKIYPARPLPATPETAARIAKAARVRWTTIYTLRKSPLDGEGIKLVHNNVQAAYVQTNSPSQAERIETIKKERFNLTPEERAAHEQAVKALKAKQ